MPRRDAHDFSTRLARWAARSLALAALATLLLSIAFSCANPGTPTGGPRDRKPPKLVSSTPEMGGLNFQGKEITCLFNENIQLKDQDKWFICSPPTAKKPKLEAHGKTLRVLFDEDLQPGATYTLDFADCLSDLNEGNVFKAFTFTFATGESTDSMMISGNVYDAQTLAPAPGLYVLMHVCPDDTAFTRTPPLRIAKTDETGRFAIKNVPDSADYRLYVLDDQNRNFLYDQPIEKIGWLDGPVHPAWEMRQKEDSVLTDSTYVEADSIRHVYNHFMRDTLTYTPDSLVLFAFMPDTYDQYIKDDKRAKRNRIDIVFNKPNALRPRIDFVGKPPEQQPGIALQHFSQRQDTVTLWMTDTTVWHRDSIVVGVSYQALDTLKQLTWKTDTIKMWHFEKPAKKPAENATGKRRVKKEAKPKAETLPLKIPGELSHFNDLPLLAPTPIASVVWDSIRLEHKVDTLFQPMTYARVVDTLNECRVALRAKWQPGEEYRLSLDSAALTDLYGISSDRQKSNIKITTLDKFGTLYVDVDSVPLNALLQLTTVKGVVTRQQYLKPSGKAGFRFVKPGDYMLRILVDDNRNGAWDTGDWETHRQPERLIYYMDKINVRSNWDIHVELRVGQFNIDRFSQRFFPGKKKR